jgi:hypothetical protein
VFEEDGFDEVFDDGFFVGVESNELRARWKCSTLFGTTTDEYGPERCDDQGAGRYKNLRRSRRGSCAVGCRRWWQPGGLRAWLYDPQKLASTVSGSPDGGSDRPSKVVEAFFNRGVNVDLHLPDGWYGGRAMENQHDLTLVVERPARLIVELDERILLTFTGDALTVRPTTTDVLDAGGTPAVEIADFKHLVVDARLYGGDDVEATVYTTGVVLLVSPR